VDSCEFIPISITELKIHDSIKVGDLSFDKFELMEQKKLMVLQIATSRVAQKTDAEVAAEAEAEAAAAGETAEAPAAE